MKIATKIFIYILLLIPTVIIGAILWSALHEAFLFHCSDWIPVLDLIPPFVHGSQYGDYYIAPEPVVYIVWVIYLLAMFSFPLSLSYLKRYLSRFYR